MLPGAPGAGGRCSQTTRQEDVCGRGRRQASRRPLVAWLLAASCVRDRSPAPRRASGCVTNGADDKKSRECVRLLHCPLRAPPSYGSAHQSAPEGVGSACDGVKHGFATDTRTVASLSLTPWLSSSRQAQLTFPPPLTTTHPTSLSSHPSLHPATGCR